METATGASAAAKPADGGRLRVARMSPSHVADPAPRSTAGAPAARARTRQLSCLGQRLSTLVDTLAPALGLDPARVRIAVVPTPAPLHGHASPSSIRLSGNVDPASVDTRAVLLHELVHTRQHDNHATTPPNV